MNFFRKFKFEIIITLIFIMLACIATYPLIFNLRSRIYDYQGDLLEALWYAWWVKYAWQNDLSPQFVPIVAAPFGIDLSKDITKNISLSFANYPLLVLTVLADEIFAYNFIMLFTFPLAGMAMYLMTYYFTRHKWGSFFAGLAFAFCPYHFAHASHITLANIQWIPLYVLFLFKLHNERTYANALLCGLFFALTFLSDTYYGYFMLVLTAAFIIFKLFQKIFFKKERFAPQAGFFKNFSLIASALTVAVLVCFPYIYPILKSYFFNNTAVISLHGYVRKIDDLYPYSYKVFNYFLPSPNHPVLGSVTRKLVGSIFYGESLQEHSLYLGLSTIFLGIFGYRFWKKTKKNQIHDTAEKRRTDFAVDFFVFLIIVAFLFSLAPTFLIFGRVIKLPSYYVYQVLPFFRAIARFGIVVMLALCVLAAFGFMFMVEKFRSVWKKTMVICFLFFILLFEFTNIPPFKTTQIGNAPEVYRWLEKQDPRAIVVEYPLGNDVEYIFYQRVHKKRLVNGALPGTEAFSVKEKIEDIDKPGVCEILKQMGVTYVILHLNRYEEGSKRAAIAGKINDFEKMYGLVMIREFNGIKVFEIKKKKI